MTDRLGRALRSGVPGLSLVATLVLALALVLALSFAVRAQIPALTTGGASGEAPALPIEILAEDGIEWQQEASLVRARGNARAIRGEIQVRADTLTAFYREGADGENEIWRLEADGTVVITTPTETGFADKGIYDLDKAVLVLRATDDGPGERVRLIGEDGDVSADQQLEYWETKQMVVARGNAVANQEDKTLAADVLVAFLEEGENEGTEIERIEAFDAVSITTPREHVLADRGVYRMEQETASLTGAVKITRGANQLNGCRAEVDLGKGTSTLFGCGEGAGRTSQVRGLIQPETGEADGKEN